MRRSIGRSRRRRRRGRRNRSRRRRRRGRNRSRRRNRSRGRSRRRKRRGRRRRRTARLYRETVIRYCVNYTKQINKVGKTRSANSTCCTLLPLPMFYKGLYITQFADFFCVNSYSETIGSMKAVLYSLH